MSELARFFKHSSIYAVGNVINRIGAFILLPVYTNYLTVGEYGTLELFYVVMSVISGILAVGLAHATLRFYFDYDSQKERNLTITTNYIGSFVITVAAVAFLALFSDQITGLVFEDETLKVGIYLVLLTIVFELSSQICLAYIRAIEYSVFFVLISILKLIVQLSVNSYLVIVAGAGITGVLFGNLCTVFLGWLILSYFTLSRCGFGFDFKRFIPVLHYCFPFLLSTFMGILWSQADKVILNRLVSVEALGIYALALKFSMILEQLIGEPFNRSYGAYRYTIMNQSNAAEIQARIVKYLAIVAVLFALGIAFFAQDLVHVMSDSSFWPATRLVPIIMIASILRLLSYPAQTGVLYAKKTRFLFYFTSIGAAVSIVVNLLLISYIGVYGACITLIITESAVLYTTHRISQRYFQVTYEYSKLIQVFLLAMLAYVPVLFIEFESIYTSIPTKLMLVMFFCLAVYKLSILSAQEKRQGYEFFAARLKKQNA